nr:peptidoglycan-recognition protein 2 [Geocoris pallidipennis]
MALVEPSERRLPDAELAIGTVHLETCRNTTIGTNVKLKGDLIVNQYLKVDGVDKPTDVKAIKDLLVKDTTRPDSIWKRLKPKVLVPSILLALLIGGVVVGISFMIKGAGSDDDSEDDDLLPMNYTARLRTFPDWSSTALRSGVAPLSKRPPPFVVIDSAGANFCKESVYCENLLRAQRNLDLGRGYPDVAYNFYIGGDGLIYEGLGWGKAGSHSFGLNCASVGVAFMGEFEVRKASELELSALRVLLDEGIRVGEVPSDYRIVFGHEVRGGPGPGSKLVGEISRWDHYSDLTNDDLRLCISP